jgi:hypothetical protein
MYQIFLTLNSARFLKNRKKPQKEEEIVYTSPIEKATSLLQSLEKKELWQKGEVKIYYSELTDIVRNYIEEEIQIPAMESTTSELVLSLKNVAKQKKLKLSQETLSNLEKVLKQADLVKFAKVKPLDFEIEEDKKRVTNSIVTIHKSIPTVVEETDELAQWNEQQKEAQRLENIKKEKKRKEVSLRKYEKLSGYPIILNTSFNVKDKTMVLTPEDALQTFYDTEMDVLILGNYIVYK